MRETQGFVPPAPTYCQWENQEMGTWLVVSLSSKKMLGLWESYLVLFPSCPGEGACIWDIIVLLHWLPGSGLSATEKEQPMDLQLSHDWGCIFG